MVSVTELWIKDNNKEVIGDGANGEEPRRLEKSLWCEIRLEWER